MAAGMNMKVRIYRTTPQTDDRVGGAVISGVLVYDGVDARMKMEIPEQMLMVQGYESDDLYVMLIQPSNLIVYQKDEVQVVKPYNHPLVNQRLRVEAHPRQTSMHHSNGRSYLQLYLKRREYAEGEDV